MALTTVIHCSDVRGAPREPRKIRRGTDPIPRRLWRWCLVRSSRFRSVLRLRRTFSTRSAPPEPCFSRVLVSAFLLVIIWRPSFRMDRPRLKLALLFGVALAGMNICFYESIDRIPLGTAVTFEFIGPLGVAVLTSRRRQDFAWAGLAAIGILLLSGGVGHDGLDPWGIVLALVAGFFWGSYILLGKRVGEEWSGGKGLAISMVVAAFICAPGGVAAGGSRRDSLIRRSFWWVRPSRC